jgi:4-carboxymuconolactone decarboxylase
VTESTTRHAVSDETFTRAKELLGEQQVVDLTAVGRQLCWDRMREESVPPGKELPFKPGEP